MLHEAQRTLSLADDVASKGLRLRQGVAGEMIRRDHAHPPEPAHVLEIGLAADVQYGLRELNPMRFAPHAVRVTVIPIDGQQNVMLLAPAAKCRENPLCMRVIRTVGRPRSKVQRIHMFDASLFAKLCREAFDPL